MPYIPVLYGILTGAVLLGPLTLPPAPSAPAHTLAPLATSLEASYNWSGYAAVGGTYTSVSGSWVVPEVHPTGDPLAADATWVGIGGVITDDLIQVGTQGLVDSEGNTRYEAWYELLPAPSVPLPVAVAPGDSITAAVTLVGDDRWHIFLINNTTGRSHAMVVRYNSSLSSAEWVEERPSLAHNGAFLPLAQFDSVHFTEGRVVESGVSKTIAEAGAEPLRMMSLRGEPLAHPTVLHESGDSFSVARMGAQAPAPARLMHIGPFVLTF